MSDPSDSTPAGGSTPEHSPSGPAPEAAGPSAGAPPAATPVSLIPRAKPPKDSPGAEAPEGPPASFGDFMNMVKMFAASTDTASAEATKSGAPPQRTTLPKEQRKFQRFDREAAAPDAVAGANPPARSADESPASQTTSPGTPEAERTAAPAGRPLPMPLTGGTTSRRTRFGGGRRASTRPWLVLGTLALLVASFLVGRASVPKAVAPVKSDVPATPVSADDAPTSVSLDPKAAKMIDEAMAAEQDRKFEHATELLLKVQTDFPHIRDLDFRLANIALEQNDAPRALQLLNRSIAEGEQSGAAYKLRGTVLNLRGGIGRGMNDFERATVVDPFSAENFYFWGEALRRAGKPQMALGKLQEAIDRLREPALEAQYRLKYRLTLIELGREDDFTAEMAERLTQQPPPSDWLLTAAAVALQHHNFVEARDYLDKASLIMDKELFAFRVRDYFFYSFRTEPQIAKYFPRLVPRASAAPPASTAGGGSPDASLPDASSLLQGDLSDLQARPLPTSSP